MKNITFEKYQGNGNDFVVIDSRGNELYKNYNTNKIFDINQKIREIQEHPIVTTILLSLPSKSKKNI